MAECVVIQEVGILILLGRYGNNILNEKIYVATANVYWRNVSE